MNLENFSNTWSLAKTRKISCFAYLPNFAENFYDSLVVFGKLPNTENNEKDGTLHKN